MKILTKILLIMALIIAFAACGNGGDTPPPAQEQPDATVTAGEAPAAAEPAEPEQTWRIHPPRDMGGRTLRIAGFFDPTIPAAMIGVEPDPATDDNYFISRMMWDNARRVEEQFNVVFEQEVIGYDDVLPALTSSVAAGAPFADVVMLSGWMQLSAMRGNLIQNIENINLPNSDVLGPQIYGRRVTEDLGGIWAIAGNAIETNPLMMGVNLDIINAIGAPNPVDLFEAGQWTWGAALDIMRLATTGDGTRFGIAGQPTDLALHFIASNDGRMVTPGLDFGFDMANTVEALEFMEQIFSERLWSYDRVSGDEMGEWARNFHSGITEGEAALFQTVTWSIDQNTPIAFDFAVVPFPLGPSNTSGGTWMSGWMQGLSFPVGTDWDAEDILVILEELFSWPDDEPELVFEGGDLGWLRSVYLTEDDVQRVIGAGLTAASDIGMNVTVGGVGYHWILGTFLSHFWDNEMGVLTAIETYRGPRQEMLDQMFR